MTLRIDRFLAPVIAALFVLTATGGCSSAPKTAAAKEGCCAANKAANHDCGNGECPVDKAAAKKAECEDGGCPTERKPTKAE
ncbi:MAG: hypothetical protein ABL958_04135 [Bdellovibrionia bacterium]